jgi:hypothetical protein
MDAGLGGLRAISAGLALVGLLAVSSCSSDANHSAAGPRVTVTVIQTPSDSPSSTFSDPGASATDSGSSTDSSSPTETDTSTNSADPSNTPVLGPHHQGVPLALADFFEPDNYWSEGSENVADRKGIQGIFSAIESCDNSRQLQLRLEDNYKSLSFNVGQANNSSSVDQTLTVAVKANGKQVLVRNISFNKLQSFTVPVSSVNALQIIFYLDPQNPNCGGSVVAVLYNAVLS